MSVFLIIFYLVVGLGILKGLRYSHHIIDSIRFLKLGGKDKKEPKENYSKDLPEIVIVIPVLREQRVIAEAFSIFSKLRYPKNKFRVIIITTKKEVKEKKQSAEKLHILARDIMKEISLEKILEKYLGLFPKDKLKELVQEGRRIRNQKKIYQFLKTEYNNFPTTIKLVEKLVPKFNNKMGWNCFYHLHYPRTYGVMSHQLNFAAKNFKKILKREIKPECIYFGVYNADSAPNLKTLELLGANAAAYYQKNKKYPEVYQQIAAYVKNIGSYSETARGYFLQASSVVQTRWALGSEIPMLRKQSAFWEKNRQRKLNLFEKLFGEPSAYCVGHGLFIRYDILQNIGYFPDETLNEDLALGFYLSLNKVPIKTLPVLENVENPETIISLIKQKVAWFWGMIDYLDYRQIAKRKVKSIDLVRIEILTIHGLMRDTFAWLLCSPLLFYILILPVVLWSWRLGLIALTGLFFYAVLPSLIIIKYLPEIFNYSYGSTPIFNLKSTALISIFSIQYLLISSVGPWITFYKKLAWKVFGGKKPQKTKTER